MRLSAPTFGLLVTGWSLCLGLSHPACAQEVIGFPGARDTLIEAIESQKIIGASHWVAVDGEVVHRTAAGYRDLDSQAPFRTDTIVRIYSMSKPITSVAAMILWEGGRFELDDPVSKYLPEYANTTVFQAEGTESTAPTRPISVRDVLRHTTGYTYSDNQHPSLAEQYKQLGLAYHGPSALFPPKLSIREAARRMATIPANHHPGERFTYGFSSDLLGALIEVWSGEALDAYLSSAIFHPLKMSDTGFVVPETSRDRFASCHDRVDGVLKVVDPAGESPFARGFTFLSGGGGLVSTLEDYGKFLQMLVGKGTLDGVQVLSETTVDLLFQDQLEAVDGDFRFGLGFAINEITLGSGDEAVQTEEYSWGGYAGTAFRLVPEFDLVQIVFRQNVAGSPLPGALIETVYRSFSISP